MRAINPFAVKSNAFGGQSLFLLDKTGRCVRQRDFQSCIDYPMPGQVQFLGRGFQRPAYQARVARQSGEIRYLSVAGHLSGWY